jgi:hypothetical protein
MNGSIQKLARLNLEPISATHRAFRSGSSGIIRLPIVQNDVIVIPQGSFEVQENKLFTLLGRKQSEIKNY